MSDLAKLKKKVLKTQETADAARNALDDAINAYAIAVSAVALAREDLENAETLETARELRSKAK